MFQHQMLQEEIWLESSWGSLKCGFPVQTPQSSQLFDPAWRVKWCLTKLFYLLSYLKVKACTKWCLCGSVVPGAPGHEHIRKPLHQGPMAFPTLIRTESGTTGIFVCKEGDYNNLKGTQSEIKTFSFLRFSYSATSRGIKVHYHSPPQRSTSQLTMWEKL